MVGADFMRTTSLAITLFAFWLALSGHYTAFLLSVGAGAAIGTVLIALHMQTLDEEGHPVHLLARGVFGYLTWLFGEIIKSALAVTKIILNPKLPITPTLIRVKASQTTPVGVTIYANSITLTPGTITVKVEGANELIVHALTSQGADDLEQGVMDARVTRFEDAG